MNVLVVGDLALDTVVRITASVEAFAADTAALITDSPGGQAANTARWLATSPSTTPHLLSTIASGDHRSTQLRDGLQAAGVNAILPEVDAPPTRVISIVEPRGTERSFYTQRGAAEHLAPQHLELVEFASLDWVHVSGYLLSTDLGRNTFERIRVMANAYAVRVSVDPSSLSLIDTVTIASFTELIHGIDLLFPNTAEALHLAGADSVEAAVKMLSDVASWVLVKQGAEGVAYLSGGQLHQVGGLPSTPVDPTGAGDAFAAGVISVLAASDSIDTVMRTAVDVGQRFGRRCVEMIGAAPS